jgi:hypothetical protein
MTHKVKEPRQLAFDEMIRAPQATVSHAIDEFFPEKLVDDLARQETFNTCAEMKYGSRYKR